MSKPIIEVNHLSKRYRLGTLGAGSLRDELQQAWSRFRSRSRDEKSEGGRNGATSTDSHEGRDFWALRDISFSLQRGQVLGIVGSNGAGKSTLLRILSRITKPTSGEALIRGRMASLLEVGTGFHPELSGRENIYLNGAILGMKKREISAKFDEIVAFSEIEKFIDTPVKRYSSGMYVRLAFAVAAHLEPDILVVDEVLAVGDVAFQRKCLGKINSVADSEGRTVILVSHNMNAIEAICTECLLLKGGRVKESGKDVGRIIREYLTENSASTGASWRNSGSEWANPSFRPLSLAICDAEGRAIEPPCRNDRDLFVRIEGEVEKADPGLQVGYGLFHSSGPLLYWSTNTDVAESDWQPLTEGRHVLTSRIPAHTLNEGEYRFDMFIGLHHKKWICEPGVKGPSVMLDIKGGLSKSPHWIEGRPGLVGPIIRWTTQSSELTPLVRTPEDAATATARL